MGKPKAPNPPDYSQIAAASEKAAELQFQLGKEQLAWAKEQYAKDGEIYGKIIDGFLADMDETSANAAKDREFYEQNFQPLEKDLAEEATNYDTEERRQKEMGAAQAGIAQQMDAQRENAQRELEAYGIDPSSTRYGALDIGMRTAQAAAQAAAGTIANNRVEDTGRALRSEAINVGRGYPGQIAGSYQLAGQQGQGAGGMTGQSTQIGANTMGTSGQYFAGANNSLGTWGNTLNMGYQNALDAWKANQSASSGWGSALGLIGGIAGKAFGLAEGGMVPEGAPDPRDVGAIPEGMSPSGGENTDDVKANLNVGEFVIPDDVVSWYGEKHFYNLIGKAEDERGKAKNMTGAVPTIGEAIPGPPMLQSA